MCVRVCGCVCVRVCVCACVCLRAGACVCVCVRTGVHVLLGEGGRGSMKNIVFVCFKNVDSYEQYLNSLYSKQLYR